MLRARWDGEVRSVGRVALGDRPSLAGHAAPRRRAQGGLPRGLGAGNPGGCVGRYLGTAGRSRHGMSRRRGGSIHPARRGPGRRRVRRHGVHAGMRHAVRVRRWRAVGRHARVRRRRPAGGVAIERHGRRRRGRRGRAGHRVGPGPTVRTWGTAGPVRGARRHATVGPMARRRGHARMGRTAVMMTAGMGRHRTRGRRSSSAAAAAAGRIGPSWRGRCAGREAHHWTAVRARRRRGDRWGRSLHIKSNCRAKFLSRFESFGCVPLLCSSSMPVCDDCA